MTATTASGTTIASTTTATTAPRAHATARVDYLALLRGAAVTYIAIDHMIESVRSLGLEGGKAWQAFIASFKYIDHITTGTRLPILVFLAALFVEHSLRKGHLRFIKTRAKSLVWPLLLWGTLQTVLFISMPALYPGDFEPYRKSVEVFVLGVQSLNPMLMLKGWWHVSVQLWFLNMLTVLICLHLVLRQLNRFVVLGIAVAWFVFSIANPWPDAFRSPLGVLVLLVGPYFLFFQLGTRLSDWTVRDKAKLPAPLLLLAGLAFALLIVAWGANGDAPEPWRYFLSGLLALPLMLHFGKWLATTTMRPFFAWAGEASLLLLCLHTPMSGIVLYAVTALNAASALPLLIITVFLSIGLCYAADVGLRRMGWSAAVGLKPLA